MKWHGQEICDGDRLLEMFQSCSVLQPGYSGFDGNLHPQKLLRSKMELVF